MCYRFTAAIDLPEASLVGPRVRGSHGLVLHDAACAQEALTANLFGCMQRIYCPLRILQL